MPAFLRDLRVYFLSILPVLHQPHSQWHFPNEENKLIPHPCLIMKNC